MIQSNFDRGELWEIETRANYMADGKGLNPTWSRAYRRLADAANILDAFIARTMETPPVEEKK